MGAVVVPAWTLAVGDVVRLFSPHPHRVERVLLVDQESVTLELAKVDSAGLSGPTTRSVLPWDATAEWLGTSHD